VLPFDDRETAAEAIARRLTARAGAVPDEAGEP
jgi:hypothetical protein